MQTKTIYRFLLPKIWAIIKNITKIINDWPSDIANASASPLRLPEEVFVLADIDIRNNKHEGTKKSTPPIMSSGSKIRTAGKRAIAEKNTNQKPAEKRDFNLEKKPWFSGSEFLQQTTTPSMGILKKVAIIVLVQNSLFKYWDKSKLKDIIPRDSNKINAHDVRCPRKLEDSNCIIRI